MTANPLIEYCVPIGTGLQRGRALKLSKARSELLAEQLRKLDAARKVASVEVRTWWVR